MRLPWTEMGNNPNKPTSSGTGGGSLLERIGTRKRPSIPKGTTTAPSLGPRNYVDIPLPEDEQLGGVLQHGVS